MIRLTLAVGRFILVDLRILTADGETGGADVGAAHVESDITRPVGFHADLSPAFEEEET